jgi:hypothetical protein
MRADRFFLERILAYAGFWQVQDKERRRKKQIGS